MHKKALFLVLLLAVFSGFVFAKNDKTYDQLKLLMDVLSFAQDNYVEEVDTQELIYSAAGGMLKSLDPYTQFMKPESYKEMKIETEGKYGGLGIRITIREDWLTVVTPLIETPAYKLGILPGDKIVKIDGESTQGITINDAVKKLRGDPGTKVKLTIARKDVREPLEYTITREIIKIKTLKSEVIGDYGYVHLYEFSQNTIEDLEKAFKEINLENKKGLIFDLRNNPGGLLDVAVDVAKFFIGDNKMIVYTKGRVPQSSKEYHADKDAPYRNIPVIVLVNNGSASGSEIVAGALKDHRRAVIVGSHTFGKASVQSVVPLSDGCGLRLTTAKYYTPSGKSIERDKKGDGGISPDVKIELTPETEVKLYQQQDIVYPKGQAPKEEEKKDLVQDLALERAIEILNTRDILLQTATR